MDRASLAPCRQQPAVVARILAGAAVKRDRNAGLVRVLFIPSYSEAGPRQTLPPKVVT